MFENNKKLNLNQVYNFSFIGGTLYNEKIFSLMKFFN